MSRKSVKARARKKLGGLVSLEVIPTGGRLIITAKKILNWHLRKKILNAYIITCIKHGWKNLLFTLC